MAAARIESFCGDLHDIVDRKVHPPETDLDDIEREEILFIPKNLAGRCDDFCKERDAGCAHSPLSWSWVRLRISFSYGLLSLACCKTSRKVLD